MSIPAEIQRELRKEGVTEAMPGWRIIENAGLSPPVPGTRYLFRGPVSFALRDLMRSFYDYGRRHWTWTQNSRADAENGGLVKGKVNAVACGSFNKNFKWLAEKGLGIPGIDSRSLNSQFLTMPGSVGIDSKWVGNVCTSNPPDFSDLKCFKFKEHHWVLHGGMHYDVCFNKTFTTVDEIIWTRLGDPEPELLRQGGLQRGDLYRLVKPIPAGDYLEKLPEQGPNDWPTWRIFRRAQVAGRR